MDVFATVRAVLAADLACDEDDLLARGVRVVLTRERPGRRRFQRGSRALVVATMGAGAVVSCDASRLEWARAELAPLDRNQLFAADASARIADRIQGDGQILAGPDLKFVCAENDLRPAQAPADTQIEIVHGQAVARLYPHAGFRHALSYLTNSPRPDMVAAVARLRGEIVGIAGASADCDTMWQIGVDVIEGHRGGGIGRAIVGRLTAEVLDRGRVPYYSTVVSNLRSTRLALGLGYSPAWVELYARSLGPREIRSSAE